jgi:hypothetical protein
MSRCTQCSFARQFPFLLPPKPLQLSLIFGPCTPLADETLTVEWANQPLDGAYRSDVKVEGQPLQVQLRRKAT